MSTASDTAASFDDLGLDPRLLSALSALGYHEPTPIQREAIPGLLAGRDLLGQAATGTGKTAAFALPLLHRLAAAEAPGKEPRALILVPTRELAMQVAEAIGRYGRQAKVRVLAIFGGQAMQRQLHGLARGVDVVIATPGRALDHLRRKTLNLEQVEVLVLDEADEMLDMGFADDLEALLAATPAQRQTALFSATMARPILRIAHRHLRDPLTVHVQRQAPEGEAPKVRQVGYVVDRRDRVAALVRVLDVERPSSALVFCRTRVDVDELTAALHGRSYACGALHGGMSQEQRDRVMRSFRAGTTTLLIATDVAARGLDIRGLSHVINFEVPGSADVYLHRIGRTARAGESGVAITLFGLHDQQKHRDFEGRTQAEIELHPVPSVAELRARQLALTQSALEGVLAEGGLEGFQVVIAALSAEHSLEDIARAAVKLAHRATVGEREERDIRSPITARARPEPQGARRAAPAPREGHAARRPPTQGPIEREARRESPQAAPAPRREAPAPRGAPPAPRHERPARREEREAPGIQPRRGPAERAAVPAAREPPAPRHERQARREDREAAGFQPRRGPAERAAVPAASNHRTARAAEATPSAAESRAERSLRPRAPATAKRSRYPRPGESPPKRRAPDEQHGRQPAPRHKPRKKPGKHRPR